MKQEHAALFQRIREKCLRRYWYGPDMDDPFKWLRWTQEESDPHIRSTYYWYDQQGRRYAINRHTDPADLPLPQDFVFPPATAQQVAETEGMLGFALPPLLRELFTTVANGGFGPGYGLNGVIGGFGERLPEGYLGFKQSSRLVDIAWYEQRQQPTTLLRLPFYVHPDRFVMLCHWGCAIYSYLDCWTERVFRGACYRDFYGFRYEASSLFEWLDLWSRDLLAF